MQIRTATEADFEPLMRLINTAFQVENFFKAEDRVNPEMLRDYFEQGTFLLLEMDGALAGSIFVELPKPEAGQPQRAYFGILSVDPTRQKAGIGRRLIAAAEEFARESGAWFMDITVVNLRTELPPLYEKFGYRITGTKPFPDAQMPITQPCHFICMTKELGHR
ncbi:GNAT family N-acetyltransferase [Silvibacterium sp.]|uniref:GNAT family N-acetyltransferase n=1 Tax=Silvibacterium sp. TaxID=1964179 RepID=UPI0039E3597B